jgi:hypothetical protein
MPAFDYSTTNLSELERTLSTARLQPYRATMDGNLELAVRLYEQNTLLAESLYGILQGLEVAPSLQPVSASRSGGTRCDWNRSSRRCSRRPRTC